MDGLAEDLKDLFAQQAEYVDDPDDMIRCGGCGEYWVDRDGAPRDCRCRRQRESRT